MTEPTYHRGAVDVHILFIEGGRVLLLRRSADAAYAPGLWALPAGHVDAGEDVVAAAIREAREETGIDLPRERLRCELVMQHRGPTGDPRTGWFFRVLGWSGKPENTEPHKHDALMWAELDDLDAVDGLVAYERAALDAIAAGVPYALHFQPPTDSVAHSPAVPSALAPIPSVDHAHVPLRRRHRVREWVRAGAPWTWHADTPVPDGLPVRQSWGWLFAPDGRVLVLVGKRGTLNMPGGTVEPDDADPMATLTREAVEEAGATLGATAYLGYLLDSEGVVYDGTPTARVRTAARLVSLAPESVDPATGYTWRRILAPPRLAATLMGGGDVALTEALSAQRTAYERLGVPLAEGWDVDEVPAEGVVFETP
jgi:8-oxo-dGTP pyrophosphatase MutT (NUDIX family)